MTTREFFRQAFNWTQNHPVLDLKARPAFTYRPSVEPIQENSAARELHRTDFLDSTLRRLTLYAVSNQAASMRGRVNQVVLGLADSIRYKSSIISCEFVPDVF